MWKEGNRKQLSLKSTKLETCFRPYQHIYASIDSIQIEDEIKWLEEFINSRSVRYWLFNIWYLVDNIS